ncbi:MAG: hypothetical protein HY863_04880 [Chloroflexi bacterium]|nr:hypothetical protein [Chloroflexota bacterium]
MSEKAIKSKIIIWGRPDVLSWAVEFFLTTRKDWDVISLSSKCGVDSLIHVVEKTQPDAVIIYQRESARSAYLPAQLLVNYPNMAVITINPDNNSMEIYNKKHVCIHAVSDLISVVEGELHLVQ